MPATEHGTEKSEPVCYPGPDAWVEEGGKVYLLGSQCPHCRKRAFPRPDVCDACGFSGQRETVRLSREGVVYSFTTMHAGPAPFRPPYILAYVDLEEGVRVLGHVEPSEEQLQIGDSVEVVVGPIRRLASDVPVISYKFRKQGANRNV